MLSHDRRPRTSAPDLRRTIRVAAALLLGLTGLAAAPAAALRSFRLPGDGPWDYVTYDPAFHRVFIGRYDGVQVVDADSGKLRATIGARSGDHGAVLAPDQQLVFTSDAVAHRLGVYDQAKLSARSPVPLGGSPDGLVYDPSSHRVLALLPQSHEVVAVDARTLHVAGRLDVGGEPEAGVPDGQGHVFVTLRDSGAVLRLDAQTMHIQARWEAGCARPSPIAIDPAAGHLFVACRDRQVMLLDATSGQVLGSAASGEGTDGLAFDPRRHLLLASNGDGSITLIGTGTGAGAGAGLAVSGSVATARGARTMAWDGAGGRAFTVTADIARAELPTPSRPYPRLIPRSGTFRLIEVQLPP